MIPIRYNLRSLVRRRTGTLMTVLGVALTVGIFVSVLALVRGLQNTYSDTGDPLNMLVIREGSQSETNSFFDRDVKGIVETMDGVSQLSGEIIILISHPRATGEEANIVVRGVSENAMELRPVMEVIEGRMFRPGLREIIVSQSVSNRFTGAGLGDRMRIGQIDWDVVGLFDARRTVYDSEIWANYDELSGEFERPIYSSLIFSVSDPSAIPALEQRPIRLRFQPWSNASSLTGVSSWMCFARSNTFALRRPQPSRSRLSERSSLSSWRSDPVSP